MIDCSLVKRLVLLERALHRPNFLVRHVLVGVRHAAEEVGDAAR